MSAISGLFKMVLGLMFVLAGIYGMVAWWSALWALIKGSIGVFVFFVGLLMLLLGLSDLRE